MPLPKNNQSPCFCSSNCPPPSKPYISYFLQTEPGSIYPNYNLGKLYRIALRDPDNKLCEWDPVTATPGALVELMDKKPYIVPDDGHNYRFTIHLFFDPIKDYQWSESVTWTDDDVPYDPNELPACDVTSFTPLQDHGGAGIILITVRSCPEWLCTDAEARIWAADNPLV